MTTDETEMDFIPTLPATSHYASEQLTSPPPIPLGFWLVLVVIANVVLVTSNSYSGDLDYWVNWTKSLQATGFVGLDANYPPIFMYWLWLLGKFHTALGLTVQPTFLLRFLVNTPVLLAHAALLYLVRAGRATSPVWVNDQRLLGLTALNPALLLGGPIWGQVDLLYCLLISLALYLLIANRAIFWALPLLAISVLTKFQAVCVAPVVLPLLWHRRRAALLWSMALALVVLVVVPLPYFFAGNLWLMIERTYIKAASLYPYASMNAHNLWFMANLNSASYETYLFDSTIPATSWRMFATPKVVGQVLFVALSLWAVVSGMRKDEAVRHWRNAVLMAVGFFMLLPAMHERYLMPAVVVATMAAACVPAFMPHLIAITIVATLNIQFILHPVGGDFPWLLSCLSVSYLLFWLLPGSWVRATWGWLCGLSHGVWIAMAVSIWAYGFYLYAQPLLPIDGWLDATQVAGRTVTQGWGELQVGQSVDRHRLSVAGQTYRRGFGTHAPSTITMTVPDRVSQFVTKMGVDDDARAGVVEFEIQLDGLDVWRSGQVHGGDASQSTHLEVRPGQKLSLIVDPAGSNEYDHADWLEPQFKVSD